MSRTLRLVPAVAAVALLAGCFPALPGPDRDAGVDREAVPAPSPTSPGGAQTGAECSDGELRLTDAGRYDIGNCATVVIEGTDIELDADDLGTLEVRGDRNDVDADSVESVELQGNDNEFDLDDVGSMTIRGDRNRVDADRIGSLVIQGNDNDLDVDDLGSLDDAGERNRIDS